MKRKTKEQREAEQRAALRKRVIDMTTAAEGDPSPMRDPENWFANAHCLSRLIPALKAAFGDNEKGEAIKSRDYFWLPSNLHYFDTIDSITDFLFSHDVRA